MPQQLPSPTEQWIARYEHAVALAQSGNALRAEHELRKLLSEHPGHAQASFFLANVLSTQSRFNAAAKVIETFVANSSDASAIYESSRMLEQYRHVDAALAVLERALLISQSIRAEVLSELRFQAGRLALSLGDFGKARTLLTAALEFAPPLLERHILHALSTSLRYTDRAHPDIALFRSRANDSSASDESKASALFALAKAYDDIDDTHAAAAAWRRANALVSRHSAWSSKSWRRFVKSRLQSAPPPALPTRYDFSPIFIVGLPRTGTTLVSEILSCHPDVTARGELTWIEHFAKQLMQHDQYGESSALRSAASVYAAQLVRDDPLTRWYIDKQPLNFRYLDLVAALFPDAKIVHCVRGERDTALSIWGQYFAGTDGGFAYDFACIAEVMRDCDRLMLHWAAHLPLAIHTVHYEDVVEKPEQTVAALENFLDLPPFDLLAARAKNGAAIQTASVWQVRQPIYHRSVGRWRAYEHLIPELTQFRAER